MIREDRKSNSGGGLAFLVHNSIPFQSLPKPRVDDHLEYMAIKVDNIAILNIYIPPASSCSSGYRPSLLPYFPTNTESIILGDFNAHDSLWNSALQDARGSQLADEIGDSNFAPLNDDVPTRVPTNGQSSSPDFSLASLALLPYTTWEVKTELGSDHLPILLTLETEIKPIKSENRTYMNFKKANWEVFRDKTEEKFATIPPPTDVYKGEKTFRKILNKISKEAIPQGRIKEIIPEVPSEAVRLMKERDQRRQADPQDPEVNELNKNINNIIRDHKREKWRNHVSDINRIHDSQKLFKLIKTLNGGSQKANQNQAIQFKGKYLSSPQQIAAAFNKQFSSVIAHKSSKSARRMKKEIRKNSLNASSQQYTAQQTKEAIKLAKASKALGPDGISTVHLKHLGPAGLQYLTDIFNISVKKGQIPAIWKTSVIVPLLKPNKPSDASTSFRPVSLLCPSIKILERLILPVMNEHLPVPDIQHGFRKHHSTVSALCDFNEDIATGFNKPKPPDRTLLLQIDLSKAFDMVSHEKLLRDLNQTTLPEYLKRWFATYLLGRQSKVNFRNATSTTRNVRTGVPQGAVTSPLLFNFYLSKIPLPPDDVKIIQYADDISIYTRGRDMNKMCNAINVFTDKLVDFLGERDLIVSPEKSTVTLFTPDTKEADLIPDVSIKAKKVELEKTPKLLGVYFDTMYCFSQHIKKAVDKAKSRVNVLKALAGSSWGQDKETLLLTYKATCRSTLEYACPVWAPCISPTSWDRLQTVQNHALRVATGCLTKSSIDHLHEESKVLPIKAHSTLLTKQYLAGTFLPAHPGFKNLDRPPSARNLKHTLLKHKAEISTLYEADLRHKQVLQTLHTEAVEATLANREPNKVLNARPPEINPEEQSLSRKSRTELARLRAGYSRNLMSYMSSINEEVQDICPKCSASPHNTAHLFECRENPTHLTVKDLWTKPKEVSEFLKIDEDEEEDE